MGAQLEGGPVVVTGGAGGIGAALVREAVRRGSTSAVVVDVDAASALTLVGQLDVPGEAISVDVRDPDAVEALSERVVADHGLPALVCANAGVIVSQIPLLELAPSDARWVVDVNVHGTMNTLQSFGCRMAAGDQPGWLMATGSEHSLGLPHDGSAAYTASKHAVLGMCDALRSELPDHLGISVLCPGFTSSRLWDAGRHRPDDLGGPVAGNPLAGSFMDSAGMPAETVAERALDGAEAGHFIIPTHANIKEYADRRAAEVGDALDRLLAIDRTDYDVGRLLAQMLAQLPAQE